MNSDRAIEQAYALAREQYAALGVDTHRAVETLRTIPISLHCWQGDDVGGFENAGEADRRRHSGRTGNYPGKARNADELRADLDKALQPDPRQASPEPARHLCRDGRPARRARRAAARALQRLDRLGQEPAAWAGFQPDVLLAPEGRRRLHAGASRRGRSATSGSSTASPAAKSARAFGRELGTPCVTNVWIPDGYKDTPVDRKAPRERLAQSLDEIFAEPLDPRYNLDAVESKLFGIGSESYVVGSHEFYLGYAITRKKLLCLDAGHFHPTEGDRRQDFGGADVARRDPAARQPRRALGQRSRRHPDRRSAGDRRGNRARRLSAAASTSAWISSTPASTASRRG